MHSFTEQIKSRLDQLLPREEPIVVGVSGGADSIFTAIILNTWAHSKPCTIVSVTVDHGLRPESMKECAFVRDLMHTHKIPHHSITWTPPTQKTTQQDARNARYKLLTDFCTQVDAKTLVTGHHALDQAETILMRFARQSHLKGLRGMDETSKITDTVTLVRPLLTVWPDQIRTYLTEHTIPWIEDPSNAHPKYLRSHLRKALTDEKSELRTIGITPGSLINWSHKITSTYRFLASEVSQFMSHFHANQKGFEVMADAFFALHSELQLHVLETFLHANTNHGHPPRWESVKELRHRLEKKQTSTLGGWKFQRKKDKIVILIEAKIKAKS